MESFVCAIKVATDGAANQVFSYSTCGPEFFSEEYDAGSGNFKAYQLKSGSCPVERPFVYISDEIVDSQ